MALFKDKEKQETLREAGRRLSNVLDQVILTLKPGMKEKDLNELAERLIREGGDVPAFLHYQPDGASYPYPATLCVSVNQNVVHGIPDDGVIQEGDLVGLDIGLTHKGVIVDMAKTIPVGSISEEDQKLLKITNEALQKGVEAARTGNHVGDIGHAIERHVKGSGFSVVYELGGHGVGDRVHEEPFVANFGEPGTGEILEEGMVLALEPIVNRGSGEIKVLDDGYTIQTRDGKRSAHFEHTIMVTSAGGEIMTINKT